MCYKRVVFVLIGVCTECYAATRDFEGIDQQDEGLLIGEHIADKLRESGNIDLYFGGELHLTSMLINQDQKSDKYENAVTSLQGDIELRYLKKCSGYGLGFEMKAKANSGILKYGSPILRTSFLFFESDKIGTIKFGYTNTAGDSLSICGDKFLVGYTGAGSGNLRLFYNNSAGSIIDTCFTYDDSKAAKIAWLSPTVSGFSAGLSFTFDSRDAALFKTYRNKLVNLHEKSDFNGMLASYSKNVVSAGLAYEFGSPDDLNAKLSVATWFGKGEPAFLYNTNVKVHNVNAYNIGFIIGYKKFNASFGYTDNGKSMMSRSYATHDIGGFDESVDYQLTDTSVGLMAGADAGKLYSAGIAYSFGKMTVSAGYFKSVVKFSDKEKAKANIISLAAEYKFDRVLRMYVEYDRINTDSCDRARAYKKACDLSSTGKNSANIFMVGSKINF
ncbi:MAG: porin [Holosporaceae bacterium]|jgi:hypothetical protein|nr:porin [Holosporaceae bacterium]